MMDVVVSEIVEEARDIRVLTLHAVDGGDLPAYEAGAHIDVHVMVDGTELIRQYSLCRGQGRSDSYEIAVQRAADSRGGSKALHDALRPGDVLRIGEPRILFPLAAEATEHLLIGGGIGITPLLSMAEDLSARKAAFHLHYCVRDEAHLAFVARLRGAALAGKTNIHLDSAPDSRPDIAAMLGTWREGCHVYVCGPEGFMTAVIAQAERAGWPAAHVHREYFTAPSDGVPAMDGRDDSFEVEIRSSGAVFVIPPDRSIAEVLEEGGLFLPLSCEAGVCGSCMTGLLSGTPDHRDHCLTPGEQEAGNVMTLCVSRARSRRLVLDL